MSMLETSCIYFMEANNRRCVRKAVAGNYCNAHRPDYIERKRLEGEDKRKALSASFKIGAAIVLLEANGYVVRKNNV